MSKSKIFIFIAISFAVGILIASKFSIPREAVYIFIAVLVLVFAFAFLSKHALGAIVALFLFWLGVGALRLQISIVPNQYGNIMDSKQQLEGYIVEDPDIRSNEQLLMFRPTGSDQNILITTTLVQKFFYGDWVLLEGKITEAKNFGDFDYQKYLERYNTYAVSGYPKILILKSHQLNPIKEFLLKIKSAFTSKINELFLEPQSSLLIGILIGGHGNLPKSTVDNFNNTGTSHIIAVSGFNITIIITALASLAYLVGRRASFWLASAIIISFIIITGASASVLRAGIMGFLLLIALSIGRQYFVAPALFFAGFVMLIINPRILFWDVGFQLSFAATLGIIYFMPLLSRLTENLPEGFGIKILILTTLSAIASTLPLILFNFGTLSLSAPFVNALVLPAVPFAMSFGFLSVLPFVGPGFALVANWLLIYILKITEFFAGLPHSSLNFQISVWVFWALLAAVFGLYFLLKALLKRKLATVDLAARV